MGSISQMSLMPNDVMPSDFIQNDLMSLNSMPNDAAQTHLNTIYLINGVGKKLVTFVTCVLILTGMPKNHSNYSIEAFLV